MIRGGHRERRGNRREGRGAIEKVKQRNENRNVNSRKRKE